MIYEDLFHSAICCPVCAESIVATSDAFACISCKQTFNIHNEVIDFIGKPDQSRIATRLLHFRLVGRIYEKYWRPALCRLVTATRFGMHFETIGSWHNIDSGSILLDIGCGTGNFSRSLAERFPESLVIGFDISANMLFEARRRANEENVRNVQFIRASALSVPLRDNTIAGVNCCGALHLFNDIPRAVEGIFRVLALDGRFTGLTFTQGGIFSRWLLRNGKRLIGMHFFSDDELEQLLIRLGFANYEDIRDGLMILFAATRTGGTL